jgi:hypothetical protein
VAVLLDLRQSEQWYLIRVLVAEAARAAHDLDLASLHARLLDFLRAACAGRPLVITDQGRRFLRGAIRRMVQAEGEALAAECLLARLPFEGVGVCT